MKLVIDIPKEFERDWKQDRFADSLNRLKADANLIAGNYEKETAEMLIDAFSKALEQEGCDDAISRQDAVNACWKPKVIPNEMIFDALKRAIQNEIEALPSVRPKRPPAEWIKMSDADGIYYCCSECGEELARYVGMDGDLYSIDKTAFCPNCGAYMRKENPIR